jgi:hypothetical protein
MEDVVPFPWNTAPNSMNMLTIKAAVLKFSIFKSMADPKIFTVSFVPRIQPRYKPLTINIKVKVMVSDCPL